MGSVPVKQVKERVFIVPNENKGESDIYRNILTKDKELIQYIDDNKDIQTLYDAFNYAVDKYPSNMCLGWRVREEYKWMSYSTFRTRAKNLASALVGYGLTPHADKLGIFSKNRPEWLITEQACNFQSIILVPLFESLGPSAVAHIVEQSELSTVICSEDKVKLFLSSDQPSFSRIKTIIQFGSIDDSNFELARDKNVKLVSFENAEKQGEQNPKPPQPPSADEVSTICYTSGTTGVPKGVMLKHSNFIAQLAGAFKSGLEVYTTDVHLSYLPLSHVLERLLCHGLIFRGASIGFYRSDVTGLLDDMRILRPTVLASVPRLWNQIYNKTNETIANIGGASKAMYDMAYECKREWLREGYYAHQFWDRVVFQNIHNKLGGRIRLMVTGAAPITPQVLEFLRIAFSCPVIQGYGQTENAAAATITLAEDSHLTDTVGVPTPSVEIKLVDVPEMHYLTTDKPYPRGELCFRGPCVTPGYFKDVDQTSDTIDEDGWLHSGDIGLIYPDGNVKLIDRSKNIFKLSQGEFVAPERLEEYYAQSQYVSQIFVHGEPTKSCLIAIVVPDKESITTWAQSLKKPNASDFDALCTDPQVNKIILDSLAAQAKNFKFKGFETIRAIYLSSEPFTVENQLITPTLKTRRAVAKQRFETQLSNLYKNLD
eukprot:TRINITY_DN1068_c5_g1_i1.p1 TRINITY_DN1068_c5_g1~~TRINITY_DN1068_c5_g1_i1.p1  ORF type:complete len:656 (-),score=167.42 TRINITY_DN1068_c5_g1_i1:1428-3395(-)